MNRHHHGDILAYMLEHHVMHALAVASFVIMWSAVVGVITMADSAHAGDGLGSASVELLSVPVLITLGACASTAVFVWFVTEDRRKHLRRIDALEKNERQAVRYLRAIMRKLDISATDVLSESGHVDDDEFDEQ